MTAPAAAAPDPSGTRPVGGRPRACWATLFTDARYLPCLAVFTESLARHGTRYPLVVMVPEHVDRATRALITKLGCVLRDIRYWDVDVDVQNAMAFERFVHVWTKLRAFELTEYERVVLVDTDMLVRRNMDELMEWPLDDATQPAIAAGFACTCNPNRIPTYPRDWTPANCAYTQQRAPECHRRPLRIRADAPRTHHQLNGGLVILTPSREQADAIASFIQKHPGRIAEYHFPDQDLLADLYRGRFVPLPWKYNALKKLRQCHPYVWSDDDVCNVHYILDKPWCTGWPGPPEADEDAHLHGWWWDAYHAIQADPARVGLTSHEWQQFVSVHVHDAPRRMS